MIEIIQEENWDDVQEKKDLPKNIKQIGTPDKGDRIYIENNAYQMMHPRSQHTEKIVYIMLGRFDDFSGHACIFVEEAIKMAEVEFVGNIPNWNDDSWGHLYRKLEQKHENMIIVGWAVDVCGQLPNMTAQLERVHQNYFGGVHQVLFLMDTLEQEEFFYSNRNDYLKRRGGFYIYYDKNIPNRMEAETESLKKEKQETEEVIAPTKEKQMSDRQKNYRKYLNSRRAKKKKLRKPVYKSSYTPTLLLLLIIGALGYSAFQNQQKMTEMEQTLAQMNELQTSMQIEEGEETVIRVEDIAGEVNSSLEPSEDIQTSSSTSESVQASLEGQTQEVTQTSGETVVSNIESSSQVGQTSQNTQPLTETPKPETDFASQVGQTSESTQSLTETLKSETEGASETNQVQEVSQASVQTSTAETSEQTKSTVSDIETYLEQGYYIVQKGDSMVSICKKIYHTTAMLDKLCEVNGIENPNAIYAGQYLDLPK